MTNRKERILGGAPGHHPPRWESRWDGYWSECRRETTGYGNSGNGRFFKRRWAKADRQQARATCRNPENYLSQTELKAWHEGICTCGDLALEVLCCTYGFYLGYFCPFCGPQSRETDFFATRDQARRFMVKHYPDAHPGTLYW